MPEPGHELRAVNREHARLDSLELYSRLSVLTGRSIDDPEQISDTIETIRDSLVATTSQESTVYGWMTQALFEGLVASLGSVKLLKTEDGGGMYASGGEMKAPDFRIVTESGDRLLVEVKSAFQRTHDADYTIRTKDLDALRAYAQAMGGHRLMFAVYWVTWNLWTLTDAAVFTAGAGAHSALPMPRAFMRNELVALGDYMIGTERPLALKLYTDPTKPRHTGADGEQFNFTVGAVEQTVADEVITDAGEQRLAMYLMLYGRWNDQVQVEEDSGVIESVSFVAAPDLHEGGRPMGTHGWLSSIYSSWFLHTTTNADGRIVALRPDVTPSMFAALVPEPAESSVLKLWRFYVHPNDDPTTGAVYPRM